MPELRRQKASGSLWNCRGNLQRHPSAPFEFILLLS